MASRFMRYIDGKKDYGKMLKDLIENGPYQIKTITYQRNLTRTPHVLAFERVQEEADLTGDDKKRFEADIDAMNAIMLGIPNDIYNAVDACKTAQAMWQRDYLNQNEKSMNASRAKRSVKTHDPLALVANHYNVVNGGRNTGIIDANSGNVAYGQQANGNNTNVQRVPRTSATLGNTLTVKCYKLQ
ncbi:hypothetical protein Tco_0935319 [Tanacetum coccineum]